MLPEGITSDLLKHVTPQHARSYALSTGWQRVMGVNGDIALFSRPGAEDDQLIVPMKASHDDYPRRVADVLRGLAEFEHREMFEVLQDLLQPDADVVRYTVQGNGVETGMLPLQQGLKLLDGARRSLLAAACSVITPARHHLRMSRAEATQLLDSCRMGQTERGSFTISISCPLRAVDQEQPVSNQAEPFTRLTTELLIKSARRLVNAIEADQVPNVFDEEENQPTLSANFCDAILRMQPPQDRGTLTVSVHWASMLAASQSSQNVTFQSEYFPIVEDIYKQLVPAHEPITSLFVGHVDALNGDAGHDGRVQGETILLVFYDEELVKVRADLNADDYQTAIDAHREAGFVKCRGVIHLGRRIHRLTGITEFERLRQ